MRILRRLGSQTCNAQRNYVTTTELANFNQFIICMLLVRFVYSYVMGTSFALDSKLSILLPLVPLIISLSISLSSIPSDRSPDKVSSVLISSNVHQIKTRATTPLMRNTILGEMLTGKSPKSFFEILSISSVNVSSYNIKRNRRL